jgi:hypothetical protein
MEMQVTRDGPFGTAAKSFLPPGMALFATVNSLARVKERVEPE